ncbi:pentapeptide repeat-containing protein [Salinibacterium sp. NG253]|uniref:pentapeptide repeat-containing protein n=1 Tax=Salinibacterium sp. NG253 TaxID=2792039 RepID=UPI0018CFE6C6|nr:pentapeptide repeat-containing protein [Salinibacterium sp. NG253]MBH0116846.1 pentapeptide repeat-containing protein [Salinibacterium sp. NG253]
MEKSGKERWSSFFKRVRRRRRLPLLVAVVVALSVGAAVAFVAWILLERLLGRDPGQLATGDLLRLSLYIAAGVGGFVALVVAYRRQDDLEQGRFVERFGAAAAQLGNSDPAIRLAGVYAMAGVADESNSAKRQQCIDVLCAYLRLPYSPALNLDNQIGYSKTSVSEGSDRVEENFVYRLNDREVRQTIVAVIANRIVRGAGVSWSTSDFDFEGATFDRADFHNAVFKAGAEFSGSRFSNDVNFSKAFFANRVSFFDAKFGEDADFSKATFEGGASFAEATFGDGATFSEAAVGNLTSFRAAIFGDDANFTQSTFGRSISFSKATFGDGAAFPKARFGSPPYFDQATFGNDVDITAVKVGGHDSKYLLKEASTFALRTDQEASTDS